MRVKRSVLLVGFISLLLLVLSVIAWNYWQKVNESWNDLETWTTASKITLPKEAENLKVVNEVKDIAGSSHKEFTFNTEYCYLYDITPADDMNSATLRCSLLPMYYIDRAKEVQSEWKERADIQLLIAKTDVAPEEFLGRQDTSFDSVSSLGTKTYPVSIAVKGEYLYPEESISAKINHYMKVAGGKKEELPAKITEYSVSRLDDATPEARHLYSQNWFKEMQKEVSDIIVTTGLDKKKAADFLDVANEQFKYLRVKCFDLNTCRNEYIGNPANNFMYMMYSTEKWNRDFFLHGNDAMKANLYPFDGAAELPAGDGDIIDGKIIHWRVFSAYEFPICPVNDLLTGKKSESMNLLKKYLTKEIVIPPEQSTVAALNVLLTSEAYSPDAIMADFLAYGGWETDKIFAVNEGCAKALDNSGTPYTQLKENVLKVYYEMLTAYLGAEVSSNAASLEKVIYESNVYSPYKERFIGDYGVARFRESGLESNQIAADSYIEWKSALSSYIMLYLYGTYSTN